MLDRYMMTKDSQSASHIVDMSFGEKNVYERYLKRAKKKGYNEK